MNLASCLQLRHAGRGAVSSLRRSALVSSTGAGCPEFRGVETHQQRFSSSQTKAPAAKEKKGGYFGWLREVFSEDKIKERKESLKDELKRGYVNDFKELRSNQGKVFAASDGLWGSEASKPFPALQFVDKEDNPVQVPAAADGSVTATLVCIAFRNGAEDMLLSWSDPFKSQFSGNSNVRVCELSLVDSALMSSWPFRGMILRGTDPAKAPSSPDDLPMHPLTDYVFHFGETREARKTLGITNMLTGYVFLLDSRGRVRWRGSGMSQQWEVDALLRCSTQLLSDKQ